MKIVQAPALTRASRIVMLLAALIVAAGYALAVAPLERAIADRQTHARMLYDEANANDAKVLRAQSLNRVKARVENDLRRLSGERSAGAVTARALRLLEDEGSRFHGDVRSIAPEVSSAEPQPAGQDRLTGIEWNFVVRARFRDIVAMLADISRRDVLLDVRDAELNLNAKDATEEPLLDATVHAIVYRPNTTEEPQHVTTAAR
ncbi:MAG: hypothetical protein ABI282_10950 [Candidatus Baltobacteraceae bacterium]